MKTGALITAKIAVMIALVSAMRKAVTRNAVVGIAAVRIVVVIGVRLVVISGVPLSVLTGVAVTEKASATKAVQEVDIEVALIGGKPIGAAVATAHSVLRDKGGPHPVTRNAVVGIAAVRTVVVIAVVTVLRGVRIVPVSGAVIGVRLVVISGVPLSVLTGVAVTEKASATKAVQEVDIEVALIGGKPIGAAVATAHSVRVAAASMGRVAIMVRFGTKSRRTSLQSCPRTRFRTSSTPRFTENWRLCPDRWLR